MARLLLSKGYEVHGVRRRTTLLNTTKLKNIYETLVRLSHDFLHNGDMTDSLNILQIIEKIQPDEIYNLAQSHVQVSFEIQSIQQMLML